MTAAAQAREGWDALALGRWAEARRSFEASLAAVRTPEGWEGLAWACFWLLDVDELLRAHRPPSRLEHPHQAGLLIEGGRRGPRRGLGEIHPVRA